MLDCGGFINRNGSSATFPSFAIAAKKTTSSYHFFVFVGVSIPVEITVQDKHSNRSTKWARSQFDMLANGVKL
jgi:hypothetical protein